MRSLFFLSGMRIMLYCVWWTTCIFLCFAKEQLNISVFLLFCWIIQFFCFQFFCLSFIFIFWLSKNRKLSHAISAFFQQQISFYIYIFVVALHLNTFYVSIEVQTVIQANWKSNKKTHTARNYIKNIEELSAVYLLCIMNR